MARILVIDDEKPITDLLVRALSRDGHVVTSDNDSVHAAARDLSRYDLILCDVMMPALDGLELVRRIRDRVDAPILFLTAKVDEESAIEGLGMGADDYIRKPFGVSELRAKVAAHLRREHREHRSALTFDGGRVRFDLGARELSVDDVPIALTPTEYGICEHLARHRGQVFSRDQLREAVLGWDSGAGEDTVSMHVSNARAKLRRVGADPIGTVWGVGYKWQAEV